MCEFVEEENTNLRIINSDRAFFAILTYTALKNPGFVFPVTRIRTSRCPD